MHVTLNNKKKSKLNSPLHTPAYKTKVHLFLIHLVQISRELKSEKVIKCLKILKAKNAIYAVYDEHP